MACMNSGTAGKAMRKTVETLLDPPGPSYEWEELVQKLCASDDAGLHEIGVRELELLRQKCPDCLVFKKG